MVQTSAPLRSPPVLLFRLVKVQFIKLPFGTACGRLIFIVKSSLSNRLSGGAVELTRLASPLASYIVGHTIIVDGGLTVY